MSDIVARLRDWRSVHLTQLRYVMESAADEIERLRLSGSGSCPEPENATDEDKVFPAQNMTTLTKQEREALLWLSEGDSPFPAEARRMVVVRGLLERMKVRHEN